MDKVLRPKVTPMHKWHMEQGANLALFGGYEMPLWYPSGVKREHLTVLTNAGIFDTSHMAVVVLEGSGSQDLLQLCFTRDLNACVGKDKKPISPGKCVYGLFLDNRGFVIDDAIVYQLSATLHMIVVNAGMGETIATHLRDRSEGLDVTIRDLTDKLGKMDIQGPLSAKIMAKILKNPEVVFDGMPYFTFKGYFDDSSVLSEAVLLSDGTPVMLSRTGYTGEFGFEIFLNLKDTERVWAMILEAGEAFGIIPCGLAARDSLRVGAVLPLSHQDIGPWPFINNPWEFALSLRDDKKGFTKKFIGWESLEKKKSFEYIYPFAGFNLRKISAGDVSSVIDSSGKTIGKVLTCATDMGIDRVRDRIYSIASPDRPKEFNPRGLSCGFVKTTEQLNYGDTVELRDGKRSISVLITDDIRPDRTARIAIKNML